MAARKSSQFLKLRPQRDTHPKKRQYPATQELCQTTTTLEVRCVNEPPTDSHLQTNVSSQKSQEGEQLAAGSTGIISTLGLQSLGSDRFLTGNLKSLLQQSELIPCC